MLTLHINIIMANKFLSFPLTRIRLFTGLLLHWQLLILLLFPLFITTKICTGTGKYFANYSEASPVFAGKHSPLSTPISPSSSEQQIHLFANLDTCRLYVYINNKLQEYLFVSGGQFDAQTPLGTFHLDINKQTFSFSAPDRKYQIRSTSGSLFEGTPTGLKNFTDGDLYLSPHDFTKLTDVLNKYTLPPIITIHCSTYPWQTLKSGMCNQDVLDIQRMLRMAKYYDGPLNGYFSEQTKQAVVNFQKSHGLFTTGAVNAATYSMLSQQRPGYSADFINPSSPSISAFFRRGRTLT